MPVKSTKPPKVFESGSRKKRQPRRSGSPTNVEKAMVAQFTADQKQEVTPKQITALTQVLNRSPQAVRKMVEEARLAFGESALRYVEIHREATETALATMNVEAAMKGSQWAITNISSEGKRIIDKLDAGSSGARVLIGIRMGGVDADKLVLPTIDVTTPTDG